MTKQIKLFFGLNTIYQQQIWFLALAPRPPPSALALEGVQAFYYYYDYYHLYYYYYYYYY